MTALIRAPGSQSDLSTSLYRDTPLERPSVEITPIQAALRFKWAILAFAAVITAIAAFLFQQLPVTYSAAASVMVDARKLRVTDGASVMSDPVLSIEHLHTVMEQLHAPRVAQDVINSLNLRQNPQFCDKTSFSQRLQGSINNLLGHPSHAAPAPCDMSMTAATDKLLGAVSSSNDGKSYIIKVSADASTPDLAANIANAYAQAFVVEQRRQVGDTTDQASAWLTTYLATLRDQVQKADAAVEAFQARNQLTPIRAGQTVITQRLGDLNEQLAIVTGELAEKQTALHQAQTSGITNSPAVLASPVVSGLIQREADLAAEQAQLSSRFGENYPSVQAANGQLARLRAAIRSQVSKISGGLNEEVAALSARKAELTTQVGALQADTGVQGSANIHLTALQREADSERKLYESLQTRLHEVDAEQHMQWPESSVVVGARPSPIPSFPRIKMMLAGVFLVAIGIGSGIAFAMSMMARTFRDVDQVEGETGVRVLGLFPQPPRRAIAKEMVISRPGSIEAETVHYTLANLIRGRDAMRPSGGGWVVMVSSALPGEGKSSLSAALGQAAVRLGMSAALLEGDVRTETPRGRRASRGEPEVVAPVLNGGPTGDQPGQAISKVVDRSFLHVISLRSLIPGVRRLSGSTEIATIIRNLQAQYELVIIDTPPVLAVPDALTLAPLVDDTVLVMDWRRTPRRSVMATVKVLMRANMEITGIVLSKVNLRQFARQRTSEGLYARGYKGHSVVA